MMSLIHSSASGEQTNEGQNPLIQCQLAFNVAMKEIVRQVSVHCLERGVLLKTIFDNYVRLIDHVFKD